MKQYQSKKIPFKNQDKMKNKVPRLREISSDEEEAYFVKKFSKGCNNHKGKYNLKYFNCGNICLYVAKCLLVKSESKKEKTYYEKKKKNHHSKKKNQGKFKKNFQRHKKSLYAQGSNNSSKSDESFLKIQREELKDRD